MNFKQWQVCLVAGSVVSIIGLLELNQPEAPKAPGEKTFAEMTPVEKNVVVQQEMATAKIGDEIPHLRTKEGTVRKVGANKYVAEIGTAPKHYLDDNGEYQPIDLTVKEIDGLAKLNPLRKFDKYVDAGVYRATWFDGKPWDYMFYESNDSIEFKLLTNQTDIEIDTKATMDGIKQTYILLSDKADASLFWKITSTGELINDFGTIIIENTNMRITAPVAWDADKKNIPVFVTLSNDTLSYEINPYGYKYPITIDPTTVLYTANAARTGSLGETDTDHDVSRSTATATDIITTTSPIIVGNSYDDPNYTTERGVLTFDTSGLPNDATVSSATLKIKLQTKDSPPNGDSLYVINSTASGASLDGTWYNDFTGWTSGNGAYTVTKLAPGINSYSKSANDTLSYAFNSSGINAISLTTYSYFIFMDEDDRNNYTTGNEAVYLYIPSAYISITYSIIAPTAPSSFACTDSSTTSLTFTWADNSGNESGFFIKNVSDTTTVKSVAANTTTTAVTGLQAGTSYSFFIISYNSGGESSHSNNVTAATVTTVPTAPTNFVCSDSTLTYNSPTTAALVFTWTDASNNEFGFRIKSADDTTTKASVGAGITTATISGLLPHHSYSYFLVAWNAKGYSDTTVHVTKTTKFAYNYTYQDSVDLSGLLITKKKDVGLIYTTERGNVHTDSLTVAAADSLGQYVDGSTRYSTHRLSFQTYKAIEWTDSLISAWIQLTLTGNGSTTDFYPRIFSGTWAGTDPLFERHWRFSGWQSGGTAYTGTVLNQDWSTSSYAAGLVKLYFNAAGRSLLYNESGTSADSLKYVLLSSLDVSATAPTNNGFLALNTTNARFVYQWRRNSFVPSTFTTTVDGTTTITCAWNDLSLDETGFRIINSYTGAYLDSVSAGVATKQLTGLSVNTKYNLTVQVKGGVRDGNNSAVSDSCYTQANAPGAITVTYPSTSLMKEVLNVNSNPSNTHFALQDSITGKYQHLLGAGVADTLRTLADWNTYAEWGGANGCSLSVTPGRLYRLRAKARSGAD